MKTFIRAGFIIGLLLCALLQARPEWAQEHPTHSSMIRFGLSSAVMESDINPNDALAAAKIWAELLGKKTGLYANAEARIYRDAPSLSAAVKSGDADIIALGTDEYLEVEKSLPAIPAFTYVVSGQIETQYLILVRNDSGINTLADLRNKRITMLKGGRSSMMPLWLDVLLYDNKLPDKESFFRELKQVPKINQAILPIFFKQMDAGVAMRSAFDTAVTLNPQIGKQLKVLAASPKLVMLVACIRSSMPAAERQQYIKAILRLHELPDGLQGFQLFKMDRLIPWDPSYANSVRELLRKRKLAQSAGVLQARSDYQAESGIQR